MSETAIGGLTARDLDESHYGLLVAWEAKTELGTVRREVVCDELRRWITPDGLARVEITDFTPDGAAVGRAHFLDATTPIGVGRRIRKARKRRWSRVPLLSWADLEPGGSGS